MLFMFPSIWPLRADPAKPLIIGLNKERPTTNVNILLEFRSRFLDGGICAESMRLNKMFIHNFCLSCKKIHVYMRKIEMICDDV